MKIHSRDPADHANDTGFLLAQAKAGNTDAKERLFARYLPILQQWAHHRLPLSARDLEDTDDIVQETLLKALGRVDAFEHRGEGAFLGYLRQALLNRVRDGLRHARAMPVVTTLEDLMAEEDSPAVRTLGRELFDRFEDALSSLSEEQRLGVILRIEFGFSHQQVAEALEKTSAEAARSMVARALASVALKMGRPVDE